MRARAAKSRQALTELKRVSENGTVAEIKPAIDRLQQASYKMAELLYKAAARRRASSFRRRRRGGHGGAAGTGWPKTSSTPSSKKPSNDLEPE